MWRLNDLFGVIPPPVAEQLSVIALDHLAEISAGAQSLLEKNRRLLDQFLDSRKDLAVVRPPAGTIVFPRLLTGTVDRLVRFAARKIRNQRGTWEIFRDAGAFSDWDRR